MFQYRNYKIILMTHKPQIVSVSETYNKKNQSLFIKSLRRKKVPIQGCPVWVNAATTVASFADLIYVCIFNQIVIR